MCVTECVWPWEHNARSCSALGIMCLTSKPGLQNACDVWLSCFFTPFNQKHIFRVFSATLLQLTLLCALRMNLIVLSFFSFLPLI